MNDVAAARPDRALRLAVVGAGPAGMAAAVAAADAGVTATTVIDSGSSAGGQYYRQPAARLHARTPRRLHHGWRTWRALKSRFDRHIAAGRISLLSEHHVWFAERIGDGYRVHALLGPEQQRSVLVEADALLLATGAYERVLPFPGWTLPGVVTAGGAQAMLKGSLVLPGREVVVAGTGPLLLPVAAGLADAGAQVKALIESAGKLALAKLAPTLAAHPDKLAEAAGYAARLAAHRIPIKYGHTVVAAHGRDRVEAVTVAEIDSTGEVRSGTETQIPCDSLAIGHGLLAHLDLALTLGARVEGDCAPAVWVDSEQRTSVPGLWAAGETTGIGGAALALAEGEIAGRSVAAWSQGPQRAWLDEDHARDPAWSHAEQKRRSLRGFFAAVNAAYPPPAAWTERLSEDTTVCRCEDVRAGAIRSALAEYGATDLRTVKLLTRAGMGWCQGRMCGAAVAGLIAERSSDGRAGNDKRGGNDGPGGNHRPAATSTAVHRPFARPVPLGALAGLDLPETDLAGQEEESSND
ncbi:MAG TPA: NAD(P)/FAD-dependent oxidoreductase [Actinocrinis sp.]|nr:NAD(P)/FAD-dependent oxidoreductase [Actinocrinis sp.]